MNKQLTTIVLSRYFVQISFILLIIVIPLGFEPKTHSLEGCCSNPTELRNHPFCGCKVNKFAWYFQIFTYISSNTHQLFHLPIPWLS